MEYIYCITNRINNKKYIGKTNNPHRRWRDHCCKSTGTAISNAIQKYGKDSFSFEILEETEDASERESYYVKEWGTICPKGYNITPGGEGRPLAEEEKKYPTALLKRGIDFLLNTDFSQIEIAEKLEVPVEIVRSLNIGAGSYRFLEFTYPLRDGHLCWGTIHRIQEALLKGEKQVEVAAIFGYGLNFINRINRGEIYYREELRYPLSPLTRRLTTKKKVLEIEALLEKAPNTCYSEIDQRFAITEKDFKKIQKGEHKYSSKACRD